MLNIAHIDIFTHTTSTIVATCFNQNKYQAAVNQPSIFDIAIFAMIPV